ncbi:hypothetical protein Pmi06nite_21560 [Planotetraspora mira]|uniref:Uncharacterized protein n=1 Tax=Planotetraspora mira TaxID=58121 RepID=A0A8J3X6E6_9ACTN|nr:hypothetical protein Pmi06nite_21560 [Planotetraspora mira]
MADTAEQDVADGSADEGQLVPAGREQLSELVGHRGNTPEQVIYGSLLAVAQI